MKVHPAADVFPLGSDAELGELAADIRAHGLNHPIVLYDGAVLDGRRRLRACKLAGVEPRFEEWDGRGGSPVDFVVSENLHRRHLTTSQRALVAIELLPLYEAEALESKRAAGHEAGRSRPKLATELLQAIPRAPQSAERAAAAVNLGGTTVRLAAKIVESSPELARELRDGKRTVNSAGVELGIIDRHPRPHPSRSATPVFGKGDKFDEAVKPLRSYLAAWRRRDFAFRHVNPSQARRRLAVIDELIAGLEAARQDLQPRSRRATLSARDGG